MICDNDDKTGNFDLCYKDKTCNLFPTKMPVFPDKKCQFYLHYHRFKMLVLSLLSWIKITSFIFIVVVEKKPVLLFLSSLKHTNLKLPILTSLSQIKIASFIFIVTYQNCQFYPYCCGWKKPVLLYLIPIKFFIVAVEKSQSFYCFPR